MASTLPVSRLIQVQVNLSPQAAQGRNFGNLLAMGDSNVISGLERYRAYASASDVADDFGANAPETKAAELYFGQSPKPTFFSVGRWLRTATAGMLEGMILNSTQSALIGFNQITSGGFNVTIDGVVKNVLSLNFSLATNLNAVASAVTAGLSGAGTCVWNGAQFIISSATSGAGVKASGLITFTGNPSPSDTVTVNGVVITFVAASPSANQVLIAGTKELTAVNLNTFLTNSVSPNIALASYSVLGDVITVQYKAVGVGGNAFTLAESSAGLTVSGATLAGGTNPSTVGYASAPGSGQDVSNLMGLTSAQALPLVPGYDAESALEAVVALDAISTAWYGLSFAASVMPSDQDNLDIAAFIEADEVTRFFGVTIQDSNVLSSEVSNDLASLLKAGGYEQTFCQYSSSNPYACISIIGRMFSVDFTGQNTTIAAMYKQEPGVVAESLSSNQANVLQAKRCNAYVNYNNGTSLFQYGVMSGPAYMDEIHGLDWLADAIQTACFNVNYTSTTKVPQTDEGDNQFVNAISGRCQQGITNGLGAPGQWNAAGFGQLQEGQYLKTGFYVFVEPIANQSQSDREVRKSPPFQVAFKLAGANATVDVLLNVNR